MRYWTFADRPAATDPPVGVDTDTFKAELKHAYDRGRDEARARRPGFGFVSFLMLMIAACGAVLLALAAEQGSFAGGGQVVDNTLAQATGRISAVTDAASHAATAPTATNQAAR
jgi:hypothetical protein